MFFNFKARSPSGHSQRVLAVAGLLARTDSFGLGICNGCQMVSNLKSIIPNAHAW